MFSNGESLDFVDGLLYAGEKISALSCDPLDNDGDRITLLGEAGIGLYQSPRFDPAVLVETFTGFGVKGLSVFGSAA